ncbi:hypothetical protein ACWD25_12550 [Streptomyces sp. NPDC002920]
MTGNPAFSSRDMTSFQPEESANTPCTSTTVGLVPPPERAQAGAAPSVTAPAASSPPRTRRRG